MFPEVALRRFLVPQRTRFLTEIHNKANGQIFWYLRVIDKTISIRDIFKYTQNKISLIVSCFIFWKTPFVYETCSLTLNVPVPYKYGSHQCVELRFHALEPHLSRTSRALPTRVPRVRRRPCNSHSNASRGSAHFHAFADHSSAHFHSIGSHSSAHFHAIRSRH